MEAPQFTHRGHFGVKKAPFPITMDARNTPYRCMSTSAANFIVPHTVLERGIYRISFPLEELNMGNYSIEARHHLFLQVYADERDGTTKGIVFEVDGHAPDGGSNASIYYEYSINMNAPGVLIVPILSESDVAECGGIWTDPPAQNIEAAVQAVHDELRPVAYNLLKQNCKTAALRATTEAVSMLTAEIRDGKVKRAVEGLVKERINYPITRNASIPMVVLQVFANPSMHSIGEKLKYLGQNHLNFYGVRTILKKLGEFCERLFGTSQAGKKSLEESDYDCVEFASLAENYFESENQDGGVDDCNDGCHDEYSFSDISDESAVTLTNDLDVGEIDGEWVEIRTDNYDCLRRVDEFVHWVEIRTNIYDCLRRVDSDSDAMVEYI